MVFILFLTKVVAYCFPHKRGYVKQLPDYEAHSGKEDETQFI